MDTRKLKKTMFLVMGLMLMLAGTGVGQTAGTLVFKINPVSHSGSYGAKHLVAAWIETESGTFVKTKLVQSASKNYDHLATWTSKSNRNLVDATSGATLSSYSLITIQWNGTDANNSVVADGVYKFWVELAWDDSKTTGKTVTSYTFTKGASPATLTPANTSLFADVSLVWTPSSTGIEEAQRNPELRVYPNPAKGLVNISLKSALKGDNIRITNADGVLVREITLGESRNLSALDFSRYSNGIYLISHFSEGKLIAQKKFVLEK